MTNEASHRDRVVDQFTRQAIPFSNAPSIASEEALRILVEASVDVTPAMLDRARDLTAGLSNTAFDHGDVTRLPYPDGAFSIVVSRLAFHHFQDPLAVLREMRRVCRPGGRVVVADLTASDDPKQAEAFHAMEIVRDPSHARALTFAELLELFSKAGLGAPAVTRFDLGFEVESLLSRSFPAPGGTDAVRAAYVASLVDDGLGLRIRRVGDEIHGAYRVVVLASVVT